MDKLTHRLLLVTIMSGCSQVKQLHSSKVFHLVLFLHWLVSSIMLSSKFELYFYLTLMVIVDMLIIFGWMINNLFKCTLVTDDKFIIVNIYKLFLVVCITHVLIVLIHRNSNANREYTPCELLNINLSISYHFPLTVPSLSTHSPLILPLPSPYPPLNKKSQDSMDISPLSTHWIYLSIIVFGVSTSNNNNLCIVYTDFELHDHII